MSAVRAAVAAILLVAPAAGAAAEPLTVRLRTSDGASVEARIVTERVDAAGSAAAALHPPDRAEMPPISIVVPAGASAEAELPPAAGLWRIRAEAVGYWSPPREVWMQSGEERAELALVLWPTGLVAGTLATADETPPPASFELRFQPTPPADGPPAGGLDCPVVEGRFRCEVPAGTIDLRLRARGFVSHYRWDASIAAGGALDLGRLDLVPGASLVGWVETVDGASFAERAPEVVLRARQPPASGADEDPARRRLLRLTATPTDRGFFHFQGLPPGGYEVYAKLAGHATAFAEVVLYENAESELREPLRLGPPHILEVAIWPPLDPRDHPWRLLLTRWSDRRSTGDIDAVASPTGTWRQEDVPNGEYSLTISDAAGARRLHHRFTVDGELPPLSLQVPSLAVHGTVRMGGEPLAAVVYFGGESGSVSVPMKADEEGAYAGDLPRAGRWPVTIESADPPVRRELEVVVDDEDAGDERGPRVDFELPDTRLAGRVVDERGRPVRRAIVTVQQPGKTEIVRRLVDGDGSFELRGLAVGETRVHAEGPPDGNSETVVVEVTEDRGAEPLLLVLASNLAASVEVRSAFGPVPGARVLAVPDVPDTHSPIAVTGVDGRAALRNLPAGTREVDLAVFAPGFAGRLFRSPIADGETLEVGVDQLGGELTVRFEGVDLSTRERIAFLSRNGARIGWDVILQLADNHRTASGDGTTTVFPRLEAGDYAICLAAAGSPLATAVPLRCAEGRLDPLGRLELGLDGGR